MKESGWIWNPTGMVIVVYNPVFRPSLADKVGNLRQVASEICYVWDPITETGGTGLQTLDHPQLHPGDPQDRLGAGLIQTRTIIRPPVHRQHDLPAVINIDARHRHPQLLVTNPTRSQSVVSMIRG